MPTIRFPFRLGRRSLPVLALFGVRPGKAYVDLDETGDYVNREPEIGHYEKVVAAARRFAPDAVVGLGGGSPLDPGGSFGTPGSGFGQTGR